MIFFYIGLLLIGFFLSLYNWFYLKEVETATMRVGFTLPKQAKVLLKGVFYICLFVSVSSALTVLISLEISG